MRAGFRLRRNGRWGLDIPDPFRLSVPAAIAVQIIPLFLEADDLFFGMFLLLAATSCLFEPFPAWLPNPFCAISLKAHLCRSQ